jgi:hypothetical protein
VFPSVWGRASSRDASLQAGLYSRTCRVWTLLGPCCCSRADAELLRDAMSLLRLILEFVSRYRVIVGWFRSSSRSRLGEFIGAVGMYIMGLFAS